MKQLLQRYALLRAAHETFLRAAVETSESQELYFRAAEWGSARAKPGDRLYSAAYDYAIMATRARVDIVTGGGPGVMDAANSGAKNTRRRRRTMSIGLPVGFPGESPNGSANIQFGADDFTLRLMWFKILCCIYVVFKGGGGSLYEIADILQHVQLLQNMILKALPSERKKLPKIFPLNPACILGYIPPIVLVDSKFWKPIMSQLENMGRDGMVNPENVKLIQVVDRPGQAMEITECARQKWRTILRKHGLEPRN